MRRFAFALLAAGTALSLAAPVLAAESAKPAVGAAGKTATLKGELVDTFCYMSHGAKGAGHKTCAQACVKAGHPVGLLTSEGKLVLLDSGERGTSVNSKVVNRMGSNVTVTGTLFSANGVDMLEVKTVLADAGAVKK